MAAVDRLSALPDDVLHRILSFAPAKRGASTAVLSRRWRPVWLGACAVSLDSSRIPRAGLRSYHEPFFLRDGVKVLDAFCLSGTELKRLTLLLDKWAYHGHRHYCFLDEKEKQIVAGRDRVGSVVLAHPSAADLEELIIRCRGGSLDYRYRPWLASLPCVATLRVLELTHCHIQPPPLATAPELPRLTDLRLHHCIISEGYLQVVVDAAPALTNLTMVGVTHKPLEKPDPKISGLSDGFNLRLRLRCPTLTVLELDAHACKEELQPWANPSIELDMPSLRSFRYKGFPVKLSLTSPAPALTRVDLDVSRRDHHVPQYELTSRILTSFSSTRALRLRLHCIEDIVAGEDDEHDGAILPTFPSLELLEVEGLYKYMNSNTTRAMARLLGSCPAMAELRLRLNMEKDRHYERKTKDPPGGPFAQSMERFNRLSSMPSAHRDIMLLGGVSDLPDLMTKNCAFSCLQKSLRKVIIKFKAQEVNCFQVQLAKFIVENAMVLEEMHVDDGDQFCPEHLYSKVARWRADSFRRRNLPDTGGFRVY